MLSLGGELLHQAQSLLHMGLHPIDVIDGYVQAAAKVDELLEGAARCGDSKHSDMRQPD